VVPSIIINQSKSS